MGKDKTSRTAYKVALNIVTLGEKPGMDRILPSGVSSSRLEYQLNFEIRVLPHKVWDKFEGSRF